MLQSPLFVPGFLQAANATLENGAIYYMFYPDCLMEDSMTPVHKRLPSFDCLHVLLTGVQIGTDHFSAPGWPLEKLQFRV